MEIFYYDLQNTTGMTAEALASMSGKNLLLNIILPQIAGKPNEHQKLSKDFINFVSAYGERFFAHFPTEGIIMYKLVLFRLMRGGVNIEPISFDIPKDYTPYFSPFTKSERLHKEDEEFILKQLENCLKIPDLHTVSLQIAFGLNCDLTPYGEPQHNFKFDEDVSGIALRKFSQKMIEIYSDTETCLARWQTPDLWLQHFSFFANLHRLGGLNRKKFLAAVQRYESPISYLKKSTFKQAVLGILSMEILIYYDEQHDIIKALETPDANYPFSNYFAKYK